MDMRGRLDELLDEYRAALLAQLDGLSEEQARERRVVSRTTLLGLVKHVTYVEAVWFDQAITGRSLAEIGVSSSPTRSFTLTSKDSIVSISAAYRERIEVSRTNVEDLGLDDVVTGRGEREVGALYLQVLRELAHHCGHADILREQVVEKREQVVEK